MVTMVDAASQQWVNELLSPMQIDLVSIDEVHLCADSYTEVLCRIFKHLVV